MDWITILINFLMIGFLIGALVKITLKYKTLKLEWEKMNSDIDVLTCNYSKAKKEISDLQDQNDDLSIRCNNEIQRLTEKYEKRLLQKKSIIKTLDNNYNDLVLKEAEYLTEIANGEFREKSLLDTIAKLEKDLEKATKAKTRSTAKKKKEEKAEEQLEIAFEKLEEAIENVDDNKGFKVTVDDVEIGPGEGEIKCEKKRRRKKGDNN